MADASPATALTSRGAEGGSPGVGVGVGVGAAEMTIVMLDVVALGVVPFAACTVNVYDPAVVGMPDSTPLVLSVSPGGRSPVAFVNAIGVVPDAVNV